MTDNNPVSLISPFTQLSSPIFSNGSLSITSRKKSRTDQLKQEVAGGREGEGRKEEEEVPEESEKEARTFVLMSFMLFGNASLCPVRTDWYYKLTSDDPNPSSVSVCLCLCVSVYMCVCVCLPDYFLDSN